jgi:hypothetical protein
MAVCLSVYTVYAYRDACLRSAKYTSYTYYIVYFYTYYLSVDSHVIAVAGLCAVLKRLWL